MKAMKHSNSIGYSGGLEKLAADLGNLRYDALKKFLDLLAEKLTLDGNVDAAKNRYILSAKLHKAANLVSYAASEIQEAWKISAPHMKLWVIVSLTKNSKNRDEVSSYFVESEKGNSWTKKVGEATLFTKKDGEERYEQLLSTCGRGTYWLLCIKDLPIPKEVKPAEAHAPLNDTCEKCGRVYCDHENKY